MSGTTLLIIAVIVALLSLAVAAGALLLEYNRSSTSGEHVVLPKNALPPYFANIGRDEEGISIANCQRCGCSGVRIRDHECSKGC